MTWELAVYGLLGVVLVGGFAWYERSRPPARMVALVAALAALAVAGRLVFAAIPNVVATTDIVLITGYAVGAAPGFAVGALAAVVSNLWLGQGPWTPWQMLAWGGCGVVGALAAPLLRSRWALALACFLLGFAFSGLMDVWEWFSFYPHTWAAFWTVHARGFPFDAAHAIGNLVIALAAGPELRRMLERWHRRSEAEVVWA